MDMNPKVGTLILEKLPHSSKEFLGDLNPEPSPELPDIELSRSEGFRVFGFGGLGLLRI